MWTRIRIPRTLARLAAAAGLAVAIAGAGTAVLAQEPLKVAFVYGSPIGDAGWT